MAGRPRNPDTPYRVSLRVCGGYRYASTQPTFVDEETGRRSRRHVYWGEVTEDMLFVPNDRYRAAPRSERMRLIFPDGWDLSLAEKLNERRDPPPVVDDPYVTNTGQAFGGPAGLIETECQFSNMLYGRNWFLWSLAVKKHVVEDLVEVFDGDLYRVNDVMTLAMYPVATQKDTYSQLQLWQRFNKTPSDRILTPTRITRLTQAITDNDRMGLLRLRVSRQPGGALTACDSTTRSAWGKCLADIRWGNNKDNKALKNTLEVVVYSIATHEPIYYRQFAGNECDCRTLRTVAGDLKALGGSENLTVVFDRGYESMENMDEMLREGMRFIVCGKAGQDPAYGCVLRVEYDGDGMPANLRYDEGTGLYGGQFDYDRTYLADPSDPESGTEAALKVNLFLDMRKRVSRLTSINEQIRGESAEAGPLRGKASTKERASALNKGFKYHTVRLGKDGRLEVVASDKVIARAKAAAGYFCSISSGVEGGAFDQYELYVIRDEQEKYFESMKDRLGFDTQDNGSELGKAGREFVLFVALIMQSHLRCVWRDALQREFPSVGSVINTMAPIRFVEYDDGSNHVTSFTTQQARICEAFGIPVPSDCLTKDQKRGMDTRKSGRKRGRPRGSTNKNKKNTVDSL